MTARILLVEDDPTTRAFLAAAAEGVPATVDTVDGVAAALAAAVDGDYDLWLIDAHLPDGDGAGLLAALRAHGLHHTPALAHTAATEHDTRHALLGAGFLDVLVKPLTAAQLQGAIRTVLGSKRLQVADAAPAYPRAAPLVWDDAVALAALNGQRAHVDALRELFLDELPGARDAVKIAARNGDHATMHGALHKLRASCGFVGAAQLADAVVTLQAAPDSNHALGRFLDAAQLALSSP